MEAPEVEVTFQMCVLVHIVVIIEFIKYRQTMTEKT